MSDSSSSSYGSMPSLVSDSGGSETRADSDSAGTLTSASDAAFDGNNYDSDHDHHANEPADAAPLQIPLAVLQYLSRRGQIPEIAGSQDCKLCRAVRKADMLFRPSTTYMFLRDAVMSIHICLLAASSLNPSDASSWPAGMIYATYRGLAM